MASSHSPNQRMDWQFSQCSLMLNMCLKQPTKARPSKLKKAVTNNNYEQVVEELKHAGKHKVNRLMTFTTTGCTLQLPPLCVAVFHRSLPIIHCLLKNGADPNRLGKICIEDYRRRGTITSSRVTPLLLALEDHPGEGFPFDPDVTSALIDAGADVNTRAGSTIKEEEEEGGCIDFDTHNTPLFNSMDFTFPRNKVVFEFLLDHGANMLVKNCDGMTPLQKSLTGLQFCSKPNDGRILLEELIRRGGFSNKRGDDDNINEFVLLLTAWKMPCHLHRPTEQILASVNLLLDAGYQCSEREVKLFDKVDMSGVDIYLGERVHRKCVYTLKHLCRLKIRKSIGSTCLPQRVSGLELPATLEDYLNLKSWSERERQRERDRERYKQTNGLLHRP